MNFNAKQLGMRIHECRKQRKISLVKAGGDLNITAEHLRKIEHGLRSPSLDVLLDLSEYFNVSTDYLLTGRREAYDIHQQLQDIIASLQTLDRNIRDYKTRF